MTLAAHAQALAAAGLPVFPVWWVTAGRCACGGEHPDGKNVGKHPIASEGLKAAMLDPELVRAWWGRYPEAHIGVAIPDGLVVVDVDPRNGGEATLQALEAQHGALPSTWTAATGGGGLHAWLRVPAGVAFPSTLDGLGLGAGLDLKQLGGYVLAPPSGHASGRAYAWLADPSTALADAPPWLLALGRPRGERSVARVVDEDDRIADDAALDRLVALVEPHFVDGKKHHVAKNLGGWLRQRGYGACDVAYVVERLPSRDPDARVKAAVAAFGIDKPFGWHELRGLLGEPAAAALEGGVPNPRRDLELAQRAAERSAVTALIGPAVHAAPPPAPPLAPGVGFTPWDLTAPIAPLDYVIPGLELAPGRVNMVAGYSNAGKTAVTQALAFSVAMGLPVWGRFAPRRCRVLHLDYEAGQVALENYGRLANAHGVAPAELRQWLVAGEASVYLDDARAEAWLVDLVRSHGAGLVVLDVLRAAAGRFDENKAEISVPLYMLGRVSKATGAAIVALHHERKPDGERRSAAEHMISGHNAIHGALQVSLSLERRTDGLVAVSPSKRIRAGFEPFSLRFVDVPNPTPAADGSVVAQVACAGRPSWGLRIEAVASNVEGPRVSLEASREKTIQETAQRILTFLALRAPGGEPVRLDVIKAEVTGKGEYKLAALDRLQRAERIRAGWGVPKTFSLVVGHTEGAFAPPVDPSVAESMQRAFAVPGPVPAGPAPEVRP